MMNAFAFSGFAPNMTECGKANGDDNDMSLVESTDSLEGFPLEHDPCITHTLNLVIKRWFQGCWVIKQSPSQNLKLVSFVRSSQHASEMLEDENRLQTACPTRWTPR